MAFHFKQRANMKTTYSLLVIDYLPLFRIGLCQLINSDDDFSLFGEASNGLDALSLIKTDMPDIILLDLNMKGMTGLDTLYAMRQEEVSSQIVILTVSDANQDVVRLIKAGADGYLLKDTEPDVLLAQLKEVILGQRVISEVLKPALYEAGRDKSNWLTSLTPRELQLTELLAKGKTNKEIAELLYITEGTVKVHVKNLLRKTHAKSRTEIAVRYLAFKND